MLLAKVNGGTRGVGIISILVLIFMSVEYSLKTK